MTTIIKFLTARLDEDEKTAHALLCAAKIMNASPDFYGAGGPAAESYWRIFNTARTLSDTYAKLRIVRWHCKQRDDTTPWGDPVQICHCGYDLPCSTLRLLALPYASHPDYREEWRP